VVQIIGAETTQYIQQAVSLAAEAIGKRPGAIQP
jgi:hypothetical protein